MIFSVEDNDDHFELGEKSKYNSSTILRYADNPFAEPPKSPDKRDRSQSKVLTTPVRVSKLRSSKLTPLKL